MCGCTGEVTATDAGDFCSCGAEVRRHDPPPYVTFTVEGAGSFPFELRYTAAIAPKVDGLDRHGEVRTVTLDRPRTVLAVTTARGNPAIQTDGMNYGRSAPSGSKAR